MALNYMVLITCCGPIAALRWVRRPGGGHQGEHDDLHRCRCPGLVGGRNACLTDDHLDRGRRRLGPGSRDGAHPDQASMPWC